MASAEVATGVVLCRPRMPSLSDSRGTVITCASTAGRFGHGMLSQRISPGDEVMLCHGKWQSCWTKSSTKPARQQRHRVPTHVHSRPLWACDGERMQESKWHWIHESGHAILSQGLNQEIDHK